MENNVFGRVDGVDIHEVVLRANSGMVAKILTWGAVVRDLIVPTPDGPQRVITGFETLEDYISDGTHTGTIAGRFANRIAHGRFELDGQTFELSRNQAGKHTLHGGRDGEGFGRRPWTIKRHDETSVTLALTSEDGDAGFPGTLSVECTYRLVDGAGLQVDILATTKAPTLCNLASHCYFNLDLPPGFANAKVPSALDHHLMLAADFYTPVDAEGIPTGEVLATKNTAYDFAEARALRRSNGTSYDLGFVVRDVPNAPDQPVFAGTLTGPKTRLSMDVLTTEPHIQLYDAGGYAGSPRGHDGVEYGAHCGVCLEPQRYPDSPNHRHFAGAVLRPGETYRQITEYRFRAP